jgi:hypothetical protein
MGVHWSGLMANPDVRPFSACKVTVLTELPHKSMASTPTRGTTIFKEQDFTPTVLRLAVQLVKKFFVLVWNPEVHHLGYKIPLSRITPIKFCLVHTF